DVDDGGRDLLTAVRRQAVHEDSLGRQGHQLLIYLVFGEPFAPRLGLGLVAHGSPYVRVDDRGALERTQVAGHPDTRRSVGSPDCRRVPGRRDHGERELQQGSGLDQGRGNVVAIAEEGHGDAASRRPTDSRIVRMSPRTWQGWEPSVSALITGLFEASARATRSPCE